MRKKLLFGLVFLVWFPFTIGFAQSEDTALEIRLRRTFGYQGGNRIQGTFSLETSSEIALVEVSYLIDDEVLTTKSEVPYRASFSTSDYQPGEHTISAYARTAAGDRIESQVVVLHFITAEESWQTAGRLAGWILGLVLVVMVVGGLVTNWRARGAGRFDLGVYGAAGGAVCNRCQLPFARHVLSPNLLVGKLERCPHCGRIAIVSRASRFKLDEAEARYREDRDRGQRNTAHQDEGEYQQMLDDSRYDQ